jgi:hypothetical protein
MIRYPTFIVLLCLLTAPLTLTQLTRTTGRHRIKLGRLLGLPGTYDMNLNADTKS